MQPIRGTVHAVVDFKDPEKMTLRQGLEWYKNVIRVLREWGTPTAMETRYIDQRWVTLVAAIAEREGVPTGTLSYFLGETANAEVQAADVAALESERARLRE